MFAEFLNRDEFYDKYMSILATRMAIGNMEMESPPGTISEKYMDILNNMEAFTNLINSDIERLTPDDIKKCANIINDHIFDGFRRTTVTVRKAKNFFPIPAYMVIPQMYNILNNYYNVWNELPIYLKEAMLHIELVRAQPFEDGNKRTARILTNYNLCKQNKAPVIISGCETDKYFAFIDNYDADGFAKFLEEKSRKELEVMLELYMKICGDDCFLTNTEEQENSIPYVYKRTFKNQ